MPEMGENADVCRGGKGCLGFGNVVGAENLSSVKDSRFYDVRGFRMQGNGPIPWYLHKARREKMVWLDVVVVARLLTIPLPAPHHKPTHMTHPPTHMTQSHPHDPPTQKNKKLTRTHASKMGDRCEKPWRVEGSHHLLDGVCDVHTDLINVGLERVTAGPLHFPGVIRHGLAISVEGRLGDVAPCAVFVLSALLGVEREGVLAESLLAARILPGGASDQGTHFGVVPKAGVRRALQGPAPCPISVRHRDVGVKAANLCLCPALNHGLKSL